METRKLLFAAVALLGAAAVVAQVESPGNMDTDTSVERSTAPGTGSSAGAPEGGTLEGQREDPSAGREDFERSASTGTPEATGERPPAEEIPPGTERTDEKDETGTPERRQAPY